jgi:gamma-glutamyl-gamma-aminobutyrate hydrolase PuuD
MQPKVFVVDSDHLITRMFMNNHWKVVYSPDEADLIQFTGGEDVSPMLYGEPRHPRTYCSPDRDQHESEIFFAYYDKPKAGICRGGQFLNVMSGGRMWQDVDNHAIAGTHKASYHKGGEVKEVQVTSTHHQMMYPSGYGNVFMTANLTSFVEDGQGKLRKIDLVLSEDVEGVWYSHSQSLCFQPHPEYVDPHHECQELYFEVLKEYFDLSAEGV